VHPLERDERVAEVEAADGAPVNNALAAALAASAARVAALEAQVANLACQWANLANRVANLACQWANLAIRVANLARPARDPKGKQASSSRFTLWNSHTRVPFYGHV
jgi:hypothetical protein